MWREESGVCCGGRSRASVVLLNGTCFSMLQCVVMRCSALQCVTSVLQCVAACLVAVCCSFMGMSHERVGTLTNVTKGVWRLLCCFTLPVAVCCSVLQCVASMLHE